jgi:hypothetical protein
VSAVERVSRAECFSQGTPHSVHLGLSRVSAGGRALQPERGRASTAVCALAGRAGSGVAGALPRLSTSEAGRNGSGTVSAVPGVCAAQPAGVAGARAARASTATSRVSMATQSTADVGQSKRPVAACLRAEGAAHHEQRTGECRPAGSHEQATRLPKVASSALGRPATPPAPPLTRQAAPN